jgi:hypothetical protein
MIMDLALTAENNARMSDDYTVDKTKDLSFISIRIDHGAILPFIDHPERKE